MQLRRWAWCILERATMVRPGPSAREPGVLLRPAAPAGVAFGGLERPCIGCTPLSTHARPATRWLAGLLQCRKAPEHAAQWPPHALQLLELSTVLQPSTAQWVQD